WFVLVLLLLVRRRWLRWSLRLAGWLLLVPAVALLAQRWAPPWPGGPAAGAGGSLGVWLNLWLEEATPAPARAVLPWALAAAGALLALDFALLPLARLKCKALLLGWRGTRWGLRTS